MGEPNQMVAIYNILKLPRDHASFENWSIFGPKIQFFAQKSPFFL